LFSHALVGLAVPDERARLYVGKSEKNQDVPPSVCLTTVGLVPDAVTGRSRGARVPALVLARGARKFAQRLASSASSASFISRRNHRPGSPRRPHSHASAARMRPATMPPTISFVTHPPRLLNPPVRRQRPRTASAAVRSSTMSRAVPGAPSLGGRATIGSRYPIRRIWPVGWQQQPERDDDRHVHLSVARSSRGPTPTGGTMDSNTNDVPSTSVTTTSCSPWRTSRRS
jgi:hypothetical protein